MEEITPATQPTDAVAEIKPFDAPTPEEIASGFDKFDAGTQIEVKEIETPPETVDTPETEDSKVNLSLKEPTRHAGESDTQYDIRLNIWSTGRAKAAADTEEEKSILSQKIKDLRKELGQASTSVNAQTVKTTQSTTETTPEPDTEEEQARLALAKLGYVDKNEVQKLVEEALRKQSDEAKYSQAEKEHTTAIKDFYASRKDIASDPKKVKDLENYVFENFKISPDTPKRTLQANLEMAANFLYPKEQGGFAQTKRETVNVTSNTKSFSMNADEATRKAMLDAGYSEEDILKAGW